MSINTSSIDTQRTLRIEKIHAMRALGIEPYPVNSHRDYTLYEVSDSFAAIQQEKHDTPITLSGRVKTLRGSGKIAFVVLEDESLPNGFQVVLKIDELPQDSDTSGYASVGFTFKQIKTFIDEGDYIQVTGYLGTTQTGQESIFAKQVRILSKCIRPLPDTLEYHNTEARYLDRTADFKMNTRDPDGRSVRDYVRARETYWRIWREEMLKEGFTECYNNVFETKPAGADAKPFTTYYNELGQDVYLRMALEIPLKKLIAGGFEKVFEIGRIFRNEGSSPSHLQDYTQIEWYWAYSNYYDAMPFTVRIYRRIAHEILGTLTQKTYAGDTIDWGAWCSEEEAQKQGWKLYDGWPAIPYFEAIRYFTKTYYPQGEVDLEHKTYDELLDIAKAHGVEYEKGINMSNILDKIYKKTARPYMTHPFFLIDQPTFLEPLAKRSPENPDRVHRWQIVAGGAELGKCFSELNDPLDQFERLKEQQDAKDRGDEEAQFLDEEFVKAMEYGMPPMSGFGMSERLISFLLGKHIREVMNFPYVKDIQKDDNELKSVEIILLKSDSIPTWSYLNTVSHLSVSLGTSNHNKLKGVESVKTKDDVRIKLSSKHPVNIREVSNHENIISILNKAKDYKVEFSEFTKEMRDAKNQQQDIEFLQAKHYNEVEYLGIGLFGTRKDLAKIVKGIDRFNLNNSNEYSSKESSGGNSYQDIDKLHHIDPDEIVNHFGEDTILEYWADSYIYTTNASVVLCGEDEKGKYIILNKTIFYPQGGGQPSDTGTISHDLLTFTVTKCVKEGGIVKHYGEGDQFSHGQEVTLSIDKDKRNTHIALHSAAHLIDYVLDTIGLGVTSAKGYHFPEGPYCEYYFDGQIPENLQHTIQRTLDELIASHISFKKIYKKSEDGSLVRYIQLEGTESICPCGGTHINNTSDISGKVLIRGVSHKKGILKIKYTVE